MFYFYMLRCKDGSLYCGSTNNLAQREQLHNAGKGSKYVRAKGGGSIVYSEKFRKRTTAFRRELEVKKWIKTKKESLIKK